MTNPRLPVKRRYTGHSTPTLGEVLPSEKYLEVGHTHDRRDIIINIPMHVADLEASVARGGHHIVFFGGPGARPGAAAAAQSR